MQKCEKYLCLFILPGMHLNEAEIDFTATSFVLEVKPTACTSDGEDNALVRPT